jgi:glycosyltransferase involved in cell wall biosynthesis
MVVSPDMFKISIITITYNSAEHLEQTIQSVATQSYPHIEYIIVDGGSTDGTLDIIKRHEQHLDNWVSEPDEGISDAMNKGVALASGDFVYFLHSDDYLGSSNAISTACSYLTRSDDVFLFNIYLEKAGKRTLHRPRGFNPWLQFKNGIFHQSAFCSKRLSRKSGCSTKVFESRWITTFSCAPIKGASRLSK